MKANTLTAALAVAVCTGAQAAPTFVAELHGAGSYWYEFGAPGCGNSSQAWCTENWPTTLDWQGVLSVQTSSTADGTYSYGEGLEAMSWRTNIAGDPFDYRAGDTQQWYQPGDGSAPFLTGLAPGASVTIASGRIVSVNADWIWFSGNPTAFTGLGVSETTTGDLSGPNGDVWSVSGSLTPVPEPPAAMLLAVGLLALRRRVR